MNDNVGDVNTVQQKYFWYCYNDIGFPRRVNHAAASHYDEKSDAASVFSFGGYHADIEARKHPNYRFRTFRSADIDVHKFDVSSRTWDLVKTKSCKDDIDPRLAPCAKCRYGHTVCSYNGKIYMFGGRNDDDGPFKAVSCFDVATSSWLNCLTGGETPEARDGQGCTLIGSTMFLHGGYCEADMKFTNTLYGLNLETLIWKKCPYKGVHVKERDFHTATAAGKHKIVVFGGRSDRLAPVFSGSDVYDEGFYCYDLQDGKWSQVVTTGYKPMGRRSHSAVCCRGNIVYFGGFNARKKKHFADVFILNVSTNDITEVRPWGEYPCARRRSACALVGSELMICGGTSPQIVEGIPEPILVDRSDTFILNLFPSLQEMCLSFILSNKLDYSVLPPHLRMYLDELCLLDIKRTKEEFGNESLHTAD